MILAVQPSYPNSRAYVLKLHRDAYPASGKFVGRTQQLSELEVWYQRAIAADRRLTALIAGAAGTGKSRLVAEFIARRTASGTPMRVVMTAANPASHHAPFSLVIDLYQAALGLPPARGRHRGWRGARMRRAGK
jgi:Cdc6-like AAA superfamily ATPase